MEALLTPAAPLAPATGAASAARPGAQGVAGARRAEALPSDTGRRDGDGGAPAAPAARPLHRGLDWNQNLQGDVARAQQAIDYLDRVATQLEALKSDLSARLAGRDAGTRTLETRVRQLAATLDARAAQGGGGLDAQLDFNARGAQQRFRIRGLDLASLRKGGAQTLGFSVGNAGGPQLAATLAPDMTADEIAARLDRTLAPVNLRAGLDQDRQLVFTTPEAAWRQVKDAIAVTGRGRVDTVALPARLAPQEWELGNPDALRQSLRETVQALARVRRAQDAAALALGDAMARTAAPAVPEAALAMIANDFSAMAASHDYAVLLAITSALSGVSRERVQALLGLR